MNKFVLKSLQFLMIFFLFTPTLTKNIILVNYKIEMKNKTTVFKRLNILVRWCNVVRNEKNSEY